MPVCPSSSEKRRDIQQDLPWHSMMGDAVVAVVGVFIFLCPSMLPTGDEAL
jgi:hypothetical protein